MTKPDNRDLREVAIRALISNVAGPKWAPIADAGMTMFGNDSGEVYQKGKDFFGNVMSGYWERMGERPAKHAYERLTDKANPKQMAGSVQTDRPRPEDDFFNPGGDVLAKSSQFLKDQGWRRGFYDNPEMTAEAIGATTAAAPLIAGGAFLSAFAQGEKPRSAYAAPVEPTRGSYDETGGIAASSNSYNPSVESARAAAQYRHDLEEQKQRHKIELMQMRGESQTPGVQGGSGGSSDPLLAGMLQQIYSPSNRPKYF